MAPRRTLALVLAGGAGGRLDLLTRSRAKPAVPFGGTHRLVDFPLSSCRNSGISDVWVAQQANAVSLNDHLANGRAWDLDRTLGGLLILPPRQGEDRRRSGFHSGTADSLWRNAPLLRDFAPDALVVLSADAAYRMDYDRFVEEHHASGAAVTMVVTDVASEEASRFGVVQVGASEEVVDYAYKPDEPAAHDGRSTVTTEVFVLDPAPVLEELERLVDEQGEDSLEDLGHELLPRLVAAGRVRAARHDGYWRDLGTVPSYLEGHLDLLGPDPAFRLDDTDWPVLTAVRPPQSAARVSSGAQVEDSLLAGAAHVAGQVVRSVVASGAVVEAGAVVEESVLLPGAVVEAGARVRRAILDDGVVVGRDAKVGGDGDPALVGCRARLEPGTVVPPGGRWPDDE